MHAFNGSTQDGGQDGRRRRRRRRRSWAKTIVNRRGNVTNEFYAQFHFMPECPTRRVTKPARWLGGRRPFDNGLAKTNLHHIYCLEHGRHRSEPSRSGNPISQRVSSCGLRVVDQEVECPLPIAKYDSYLRTSPPAPRWIWPALRHSSAESLKVIANNQAPLFVFHFVAIMRKIGE